MTTPTPTSNDALNVALPPGLPDAATLARLATDFFAALPGSGDSVSGVTPRGSPAQAAVPASLPAQDYIALEPARAAGIPEHPVDPAIAATSLPVGNSIETPFSVPEGYAAALPSIGIEPAFPGGAEPPSAPGLAPTGSPYYFLGESSAYTGNYAGIHSNTSAPADASSTAAPSKSVPGAAQADRNLLSFPAVDTTADDRVTAQPYGLPGAEELQALIADLDPFHAPASQDAPQRSAPASPTGFYFIEAAPVVSSLRGSAHPGFDVNAVRRDFPILSERVNGRQLVWFDNAATTQKPQSVIDRLAYFYAHENSNIHRAAHELAARATDAYEAARSKVARFIGADAPEQIIFVRGTTEAINLVAQSWGRKNIGPGDEIIVSHLEHHANIVPWQQLAAEKGAKIRVIPVDDSGQVLLEEYQRLLNDRTKLVAVTQVSNALGTVVPVKEIVDLAHRAGAKTLVDGAQSVSHMRVNMTALDTDFFVFSGHKVFAPTGIGVVYGKREVLEAMPPWQGGGNMIADVTFERTVYQPPPSRFEAGTGNIADAVGLGAAIDYVERIGIENIAAYEHALLEYATHGLKTVPGLRLIGTARDKASVLSFVLPGYKPEEVGKALNQEGIAVRAGHHCAQPILRRFGLEATVRPSLAFYNTCEEVDHLVAVLRCLASGRGLAAAA